MTAKCIILVHPKLLLAIHSMTDNIQMRKYSEINHQLFRTALQKRLHNGQKVNYNKQVGDDVRKSGHKSRARFKNHIIILSPDPGESDWRRNPHQVFSYERPTRDFNGCYRTKLRKERLFVQNIPVSHLIKQFIMIVNVGRPLLFLAI